MSGLKAKIEYVVFDMDGLLSAQRVQLWHDADIVCSVSPAWWHPCLPYLGSDVWQ